MVFKLNFKTIKNQVIFWLYQSQIKIKNEIAQ